MVMKSLLFTTMTLLSFGILSSQELEGAWKLIEKDSREVLDQETIKIYQDGYFSFGTRDTETNEFIKAGGGEYSVDDGYVESFDFHTQNPKLVGTNKKYQFQLENEKLSVQGPADESQVWLKLSDKEDDLSGNWVITGRKRNGEIRTSTPGARRTIKLLGGGRFQWVAFNSDTREFSGTGGGTYSAEDGKYIENIEFFSRDDSRVGTSLDFNYEVRDGEWHHSRKSSKGESLYEIWSAYNEAYKQE